MISVVLPYYNAETTLESAIKSILSQSYSDLELLLINNNSSDSSQSIALYYQQKDARITLLSESKQGVVFAANLGLEKAKGDYIARMDADDVSHSSRFQNQIDEFRKNVNLSICATQVNYCNAVKTDDGFSHFVDWNNHLLSHSQIYTNRFVEFPVVNPSLMFKRALIADVGLFKEGDFPEDYEWFLRAMELSHKITKIEKPLLDWHDSINRLTRTDARYESEQFFKIKTTYLANHLKTINTHKVWIWGAGKLGLRRSQLLSGHDIEIAGYIDIKHKSLQNFPCVHFEAIELLKQPFIISYITNRGKRNEVRNFLNTRGYEEGISYIIAG